MTLSVFSKDKLVFDTTAMLDSDNIGAFVRSSDGSLITDHELIESEYANLISQGLIFKSKLPGTIGNSYSFTVIDNGGTGPITFTELAGAIVVDLAGLTPTKAQVVTLLSTSAYANVSLGTLSSGNVVVAAVQSFANGEDSAIHKHLDVYSATADGEGNPITSTGGALDVNIASSDITLNVDLNGIYNAITNPTPDNVGIIGSSRAVPGLANQTLQFTGAGVSSDNVAVTNIVAQDVNAFGMMWDSTSGGQWDRLQGNQTDGLFVNLTNTSIAVTQSVTPWLVAGDIADDAPDASSDPVKVGSHSRWGALTALSNDADRADLISDKYRRIYVNNGSNIAIKALNLTAGATEVELKSGATALPGRRTIMIRNNSNKEIYIGETGVLATTGMILAAGSALSLDIGQDVAVFALGSTTGQNLRILETA